MAGVILKMAAAQGEYILPIFPFSFRPKKNSRQKEGALAENGLHVCRTIFTTSAAFLLASRVKKVHV
jgi:hypothetical protein